MGADAFQTAFWGAKRALRAATEEAFGRHGVRGGQEFILMCLWERDGQTPGEVARRWQLATPTVTRAAMRMEAAGLLDRRPDGRDRRLVRLHLTPRGRALQTVLSEAMRALNERALQGMTDAERDQFVRQLVRVQQNLARSP